mgnify:FL=1|tara:strand:- start:63 stop:419 length:357 start_codon:yes stop_codon:yes gene_type:complete
MCINLIYSYPSKSKIKTVCLANAVPFLNIFEMDEAYLTLIEPEDVDSFISDLETASQKVTVIGSYNKNGTHYIFDNVELNHTIEKYRSALKGNPTEAEALQTQVNLMSGHPNRILTNQ